MRSGPCGGVTGPCWRSVTDCLADDSFVEARAAPGPRRPGGLARRGLCFGIRLRVVSVRDVLVAALPAFHRHRAGAAVHRCRPQAAVDRSRRACHLGIRLDRRVPCRGRIRLVGRDHRLHQQHCGSWRRSARRHHERAAGALRRRALDFGGHIARWLQRDHLHRSRGGYRGSRRQGPTRMTDRTSMIRVDQAGENGATRIYAGQRAVMGDRAPHSAEIRTMAEQEAGHLAVCDEMIARRGVRPTALQPLWSAAGYALGAATALMGPEAAMACTAAVEEEIDRHYTHQLDELERDGDDPELATIIERFRADEREHRDAALAAGAERAPAYPLLNAVIRLGCRAAIRLSERI